MRAARMLAALVAVAAAAACGKAPPADGGEVVVRFGHFPNVTHAHGLVAHAKSRLGEGWFEQRLGPGVRVEWFTYNAGPSAMEGLLTGALDATYVGPNPAINAHVKSRGEEVRVLAGATRGGSALVVQGDGRIKDAKDFRGRRLATPQLGNTQDVAARAWLRANGYSVTQTGGDVTILPTTNADLFALFVKGDIDAAWTVEPWVSRLEREAGGKVLLAEDDVLTTLLASSAKFLRERPELAAKLRKAHEELTAWIAANPADAQRVVAGELSAETKVQVSPELIAHCWPRMRFADEISAAEFAKTVKDAQDAGFLQDAGDVAGIIAPR